MVPGAFCWYISRRVANAVLVLASPVLRSVSCRFKSDPAGPNLSMYCPSVTNFALRCLSYGLGLHRFRRRELVTATAGFHRQ